MKFKLIFKIYTFLFLIFDNFFIFFDESHVNSSTITNGVFPAAEVLAHGQGEYCASAPES